MFEIMWDFLETYMWGFLEGGEGERDKEVRGVK